MFSTSVVPLKKISRHLTNFTQYFFYYEVPDIETKTVSSSKSTSHVLLNVSNLYIIIFHQPLIYSNKSELKYILSPAIYPNFLYVSKNLLQWVFPYQHCHSLYSREYFSFTITSCKMEIFLHFLKISTCCKRPQVTMAAYMWSCKVFSIKLSSSIFSRFNRVHSLVWWSKSSFVTRRLNEKEVAVSFCILSNAVTHLYPNIHIKSSTFRRTGWHFTTSTMSIFSNVKRK